MLLALALNLVTPRPAEAFIHEIIAALCRAPVGDVEPPGASTPTSKAFIKALMATGFIVSIVETATTTTITFDPTVPNSKFRSTGADVVIPPPPGAPPDAKTLILSPGVEPDPEFAAHAHCRNY